MRTTTYLERLCTGRRFRNGTERLEKPFELHTQMTGGQKIAARPRNGKGPGA